MKINERFTWAVKEYIGTGKVKLVTADLARAKLAEQYFDKIAAFNVNIFWQGSEKDFQQIRHCLKPPGLIYIFYQTPSFADPKLADKIKAKLQQHHFTIIDTITKKAPEPCICIIVSH